ncbi:hypothetical protein [uncultured Kordia sp.]|uniref:hypothetical protein n=1 Tax=uncultured Kordia sp. TaxID=507699 RepID=UPI00262AC044|nr:hypothetical protein [uncultured Kordia sp.]
MKVVKIALLVFTIAITILLFVFSFIMYSSSRSFQGASSAFFFLACTSAFSIFFHMKTFVYYPLQDFEKTIVELSKKYWALHVSFGVIIFLLGMGMIIPAIKANDLALNQNGLIGGTGFLVFGMLTLIETYKLNKFVETYKERRELEEDIEEIGGDTDS